MSLDQDFCLFFVCLILFHFRTRSAPLPLSSSYAHIDYKPSSVYPFTCELAPSHTPFSIHCPPSFFDHGPTAFNMMSSGMSPKRTFHSYRALFTVVLMLTYKKNPIALAERHRSLGFLCLLCVLRFSTLRLPTWRQIAVRPVHPQFLVSSFSFRFPSFVLASCSPTRRDRVFRGASSSIRRPLPSIFLRSHGAFPVTTFEVLTVRDFEGFLSSRCHSSFAHRASSNSFEDVSLSCAFFSLSLEHTHGHHVCASNRTAQL